MISICVRKVALLRFAPLGIGLVLLLSSCSCQKSDPAPASEQYQGGTLPVEAPPAKSEEQRLSPLKVSKTEPSQSDQASLSTNSPSEFSGDPLTVNLPGTFRAVAVGGAGRYLVFHLDQLRLLAIFDVSAARVTEYLPVESDDITFTAGLEKLVVVLRDQQKIQRFDLQTHRLELTRPLSNGDVTQISMGSASAGPIFLCRGEMSVNAENFLDLQTLEPAPLKRRGSDWKFKDVNARDCIVHASADGTVFGVARPGVASHSGYGNLIIKRNQIQGLYQDRNLGVSLPGPDGNLIYSFSGIFTNTLHKVLTEDHSRALPASLGNLHMRVRADSPNVTIHQQHDPRPLLTIPQIVPSVSRRDWHKDFFVGESPRIVRLHYFPDHDLLAYLPATNNHIVLHRVHLQRALEKSPLDYLLITSQPHYAAKRGSRYRYQFSANAKQQPVQTTIVAGPEGMTITPQGNLNWQIPATFNRETETVILSIKDATGQEVFQTWQINIEGQTKLKNKSAVPVVRKPDSPQKPEPGTRQKTRIPEATPPLPESQQRTVNLPGTIDDLSVGGGGRYLVLHLLDLHQLAVFDMTRKAVVKYIPVDSDDILFTAGADDLIILLRDRQIFERWNLKTFQRELTVASPVAERIAALVMGYDSAGPLVLFAGDDMRKMSVHFFDPDTMRELQYQSPHPLRVSVEPHHVKASADGTLISYGAAGVLILDEQSVSNHPTQIPSPFVLLPSADGSVVYTPHGFMSRQMTPINRDDPRSIPIPSVQPGFYLMAKDQPQNKEKKELYLYSKGAKTPLAQLTGVNPSLSYSERQKAPGPHVMAFSKHFQYLPFENLLIQIPATNQSLILHEINLEKLLKQSNENYLFAVSHPLPAAIRGKHWTSQLDVRSKQGGVQYQLDAGPEGMSVSPSGLLSWQVPDDFPQSRVSLILSITDTSGQQIFQTDSLSVKGPLRQIRQTHSVEPANAGAQSEKPLSARKPWNLEPLIAPKPESQQTRQRSRALPDLPALSPVQFQGIQKTVKLPTPLSDYTLGGGGRYLIMHLPELNQLAVFDSVQTDIIKYLPVEQGRILFTAGAQHLIVSYPDKNLFQRWSLSTFKLEQTVTCQTPAPLTAMIMGHSSAGPVVLFAGTGPRNFKPLFLDPLKLELLSFEYKNPASLFIEPHFIQASADGRVIGYGNEGILLLSDSSVLHVKTQTGNPQLLIPNFDGSIIYSPYYILDTYLNVMEKTQTPDMRIPSVQPGYFMRIPRDDRKPQNFGITFYSEGNPRPLITVTDIDVPLSQSDRYRKPQSPTFFRRFIFLPAANALVQIPATNDRLIIYKMDLLKRLQQSDIDYLYAVARPESVVPVNQNWKYQIEARSRQGDVSYEIINAPQGMTISKTGQLAWQIPEIFSDSTVKVTIKIHDRLEQEYLYSFTLHPQ